MMNAMNAYVQQSLTEGSVITANMIWTQYVEHLVGEPST